MEQYKLFYTVKYDGILQNFYFDGTWPGSHQILLYTARDIPGKEFTLSRTTLETLLQNGERKQD